MNFDDEAADFFEDDDLFGDTDAMGADEAIEDNRYDGKSNDEVSDFLKKEKKAVGVKRKANPRSLLNERLLITGNAGIHALKKSFTNYKPNMKADPYSNLPELLKKYQHWAHVIAPRMKFEDVIARCEQLGEKRPIKVYMQKMRLGMPLTDEDFDTATDTRRRHKSGDGLITTEYASDKENSDRETELSPPRMDQSASSKLVDEPSQKARSLFGPAAAAAPAAVPGAAPAAAPGAAPAAAPGAAPAAFSVPAIPTIATPLTEEQRRRVAENRMRALELRQKRQEEERLQQQQEEEEKKAAAMNDEQPDAADAFDLDEDEIMAQFDDFE